MGGTITALVAQKRNKERVNVYLNGEFAFGLAMAEAMKLHKGQFLSEEEIAHLKALDEIETAHEHALNFLSYRMRSSNEVRESLRRSKRQFSEAAIEAAIERLERAGLLDDAAFARFWIESRERFAPRSARALRYELRQKGVPDEVIGAALADLDEEQAALRAAESKVRRYAHAEEEDFRHRLGSYLLRRGFSRAIVRDVLNRLWSDRTTQARTTATNDTDTDGEA